MVQLADLSVSQPFLDTWYSQLISLFPYPSWTRGTVSLAVCFLSLPGHMVQSAYLSGSLPFLDTWYSQPICLFPYPSWTRGTVS